MTDSPALLSTAQVATELGVTVRYVTKLASKGKLKPAGKVAGRTGAYMFQADTVTAYQARRADVALDAAQLPLLTPTRTGRLKAS